jgi:hypothetical protein
MYFTRENFMEDKFKDYSSSLGQKIFFFSFFAYKNRGKIGKISKNYFKYFLKLYLRWEQIIKHESKDCPKQIYFKIFLLKNHVIKK